jgi:peptidoglycan/xylan/chitin deacetylase (PgdA/CDA1 family)
MNAPTTRKALKSAALPFGMLDRRSPDDLVVLIYHRVGSTEREIDISAADFERQIEYLARSGRARMLDAALGDCRGGVVVTIDDGFRDFYDIVVPVLVRHRVPAHLYLATGFVRDEGGPPDGLSWDQIEESVATGLVTIGAHTHTHADLGAASEAAAYTEMVRSKDLIEQHLGTPCRHFAYPWSYASPGAEKAARGLFDSAALLWRTNRRGRLDPHRLGRTPVMQADGLRFFRAKVNGHLDKEALIYKALRKGPWSKR